MAFDQQKADEVCIALEDGLSLRAACVEIYAIHDPITGDIRYIGKAKNSVARFKQHLSCDKATPIYAWIRQLREKGLTPTMSVLMSTWDWESSEVTAIAQFKADGCDLLNVAMGGNQPFCPRSVRAANGASNAKKVHEDPDSRFIWWLKKRLGDGLKRGHLPEEVKEKMRIAAMKCPDLFGAWSVI